MPELTDSRGPARYVRGSGYQGDRSVDAFRQPFVLNMIKARALGHPEGLRLERNWVKAIWRRG